MDYPKFIVSNQKEESICLQMIKSTHFFNPSDVWVQVSGFTLFFFINLIFKNFNSAT